MTFNKCAVAALLSTVGIASTYAQTVFTAKTAGSRPVISRDAKGFDHCGIRVVVQDEKFGITDAYDITLHVFPTSFAGALEVGRLRMSPEQKNPSTISKLNYAAPTDFWIAQDIDSKPLPATELKSGTPGKILQQTPIVETRNMVVAIANGKRIQFSAQHSSEKGAPRVLSFTAPLRDEDRASFAACIDSLPKRMQEEEAAQTGRTSDTPKTGK